MAFELLVESVSLHEPQIQFAALQVRLSSSIAKALYLPFECEHACRNNPFAVLPSREQAKGGSHLLFLP
jgi:hypothetical protein